MMLDNWRTLVARCWLGGAVLAVLGCVEIDFSGPGEDKTLPVQHGPALDSARASHGISWSANGDEFAYVLPDLRTAVARSVSTGQRRVLHSVSTPAQITHVAFGRDGEWFVSFVPGPQTATATIERHTGSSVEILTARTPAYTSFGAPVVSAGDAGVAYVVAPDSLFARAGNTAAPVFLGAGCRGIAAISPALDGAVCYGQDLFTVFRFAAGTAPVALTAGQGARILDVVWNGTGLHLLWTTYSGGDVYGYERVSAPQSRYVTPAQNSESGSNTASLSRDARTFAYMNAYCAQSSGFLSCGKTQMLIYVADAVSRTTTRMAVHNSSGVFAMRIAASPTGKHVAYIVDSRLFLAPTGR